SIPSDIRDRDADVWEPLFAIAQIAGGEWLNRVIASARWFVSARTDDSADSSGLRLLRDCVTLLEKAHTCEPDWLRRELVNMSDGPWGAWGKNGNGLTTFDLKRWLKDYGIKPYAVRVGGAPVKGYHVKQFKDELARYPAPTEGDGYTGYNGYNVDNKNNDVTDVNDVTTVRGSEEPPPEFPYDDLTVAFEERRRQPKKKRALAKNSPRVTPPRLKAMSSRVMCRRPT